MANIIIPGQNIYDEVAEFDELHFEDFQYEAEQEMEGYDDND